MNVYEFYNKHYIRTDDRSRIVDGWSDGPLRGKPTDGAICINERGGYQFRLILGGQPTEENPALYDWDGIPIYKYEDGGIQRRTPGEIAADHVLPLPVIDDRDVALAELAEMTADNMMALAELAGMIEGGNK